MKTHEEIIKEVLPKSDGYITPYTIEKVKKTIAETREDCEKVHFELSDTIHLLEKNIQDLIGEINKLETQNIIQFSLGQKAERKRILEKFGKALRKANWDTKHSCDIFGTETLNKIEEELEKEVLKE